MEETGGHRRREHRDRRLDYSSGWSYNGASYFVRHGVGTYRATLFGIGGEGTPHVSAWDVYARCKLTGWGPDSVFPDEHVWVKCFNRAGQPVDARFTLSFTNTRSTAYRNARLWYTGTSVPAAYRYNSAGGVNSVSRTTTGTYRALLPRLGSQGGTVQVTATGSTANWCKVSGWGSDTTTNQVVTVRCFTPSGAAGDSGFVLSYAQGGSILGTPNLNSGHGLRNAYAAINPASAPQVATTRRYSSLSGTAWSITNHPDGVIGLVRVNLPTAISDGHDAGSIQVTAQGGSSNDCVAWSWYENKVTVACYNPAGQRVLTPFVVSAFYKHQ